jgi:hypothetical protein
LFQNNRVITAATRHVPQRATEESFVQNMIWVLVHENWTNKDSRDKKRHTAAEPVQDYAMMKEPEMIEKVSDN